jgi:hypothetical protein
MVVVVELQVHHAARQGGGSWLKPDRVMLRLSEPTAAS